MTKINSKMIKEGLEDVSTHKTLNSSHSALRTVKDGGASTVLLGCFSHCAVRLIYHIPDIMDQFENVTLLKEVVLPYVEEEMPWKWVFEQDNNPKLTSQIN